MNKEKDSQDVIELVFRALDMAFESDDEYVDIDEILNNLQKELDDEKSKAF